MKNEAILRGVLQKWKVECRADGLVPMRSCGCIGRCEPAALMDTIVGPSCIPMHSQERPVPVKISGLYSCTFKLGSRSSWLFPMKPWFAVSVVEAIWYRLSSEFRNSFSDLVSFFRLAVSLIVLIINSAPCWEQLLPGRAGEKEPDQNLGIHISLTGKSWPARLPGVMCFITFSVMYLQNVSGASRNK